MSTQIVAPDKWAQAIAIAAREAGMARRGLGVPAQPPPIPPIYETVWQSQRPYQIWYGGRGGAKSWTKAIYFLLKAQSQDYFRLIFARDTQRSVRKSQYQLFKDIARKFDCFRDQFDFHDSDMRITHKGTGNFMTGGSFEQPDTIRSIADPTDFWAEEPITREAQISRQSFLDIVGSLRNSYGVQTKFHFTFNPISKETWIYEDFFEKDLYDCEKLFVNYFDNPYCPQPIIDFLESLKRIDPARYKVDALGEWGVRREGLILPEYDTVDAMPEAQFYGLDFGYNDPTALVAVASEDIFSADKKNLYVEELLYQSGLTSAGILDRFNLLGVRKNTLIIADNARPEMIQDISQAGYYIQPCLKYKGSVVDGINRILKYDLKLVRGSKNLFDEIKNYVWKMKNEKNLDEPEDGMNHLMDAMRYGTERLSVPSIPEEESNYATYRSY